MTPPPKGAVAAGHETTANAAAEILVDGGNAFDAVLAGLLASTIPEIVLASLGGGGHLMAYQAANNKTTLYDFFVDTPAHNRPPEETDFRSVIVDFGPAQQEFHAGIGASAVPGLVPGIYEVHADLGSLPIKRIIEPAIRAARDGVEMNDFHAYLFKIVDPILTPNAKRDLFCGPNSKLLTTGQTLRNENLANTLGALASEGPDLFINGDVGQTIVRQSRDHGGHLTHGDLANYTVHRRTPLTHTFQNHTLALNPAPAASGPLIAFGFSLLKALTSNSDGKKRAVTPIDLANIMAATNDVRRAHEKSLEKITGDDVIAKHLAAIRKHAPAPNGTTHISVIDANGNAAAATISNGEGNGVELADYGFMLNNMLGEEDLNPDGFNNWAPGTRMSTMMAPTIMRGPGGTLTAMGSGGSNRIRTAILQVALNLIDHDMSLSEAINAPRMHYEKCGTLSFEDHFPHESRASLMQAFPNAHPWPDKNMFFGGVHATHRDSDGSLTATPDPRRAGAAVVVGG